MEALKDQFEANVNRLESNASATDDERRATSEELNEPGPSTLDQNTQPADLEAVREIRRNIEEVLPSDSQYIVSHIYHYG